MAAFSPLDYAKIYTRFHSPTTMFDCGNKCSPYNEHGVPFCCDTHHAVPTAYQEEWEFLRTHTDLWHLWQPAPTAETMRLRDQTPQEQVLIECLGHLQCQRQFRSITCRAFPFFPYITREGIFTGLTYYWEYEDRCWVISNLNTVTKNYRNEFVAVYDKIFKDNPTEKENFQYHAKIMRRIFGRRGRAIPLLHRNGYAYKVTPRNGRMRRAPVTAMAKFNSYKIAAEMPFPDELEARNFVETT